MPQLHELIEKKKFVKKNYRPWDLSGTGTIDGKDKHIQTIESESTVDVTTKEPVLLTTETSAAISIEKKTLNIEEKSGNKSGNVTGNNKVTLKTQQGNNEVTYQQQQSNIHITTRKQIDNISDNVTANTESFPYLLEAIKKLTGIQKNLFSYVISLCSARGVLDTGNILSLDLAHAANCTVGCVKTSLIRLTEKSLIIRLQGKASRGGHLVLGITKEIQAASIQAQQALFNPFKAKHTDNIRDNETANTGVYSSSNKNITTTNLTDEWKKIDFDPLLKIGFSTTQLTQLMNTNATTPDIVQESINHFAFGLENKKNVKAYGDPLNVFMGVLRKGQRWTEPGYISPKELAMRQILDEKREQKQRLDAIISELMDLDFPIWRKKLTEEEIKKIVPLEVMKTNLSGAVQSCLRSYYLEKILLPKIEGK